METAKTIYSLSKLSQSLERFVRDNFALKNFWVIAEITKVQEKNGHRYLELADSIDGKRVAEMSANMWFSTYNRVNENLKGELPLVFKQGNKVLVNVRIEYHVVFGLKLNILNVDPAITYGEIEEKKKETIKRLKKEGFFDLQHGLYLPPVIKKIALIGSPNTSGYRDFLSELKSNSIFKNFSVKEFAASVQGEKAIKEVVRALERANEYNVDVIVLVRGGGSKMDLNVFNSYEIAVQIANSRIPVITGIGHENDEVVADLVARKKEITPTAVAKYLYVRAGVFRGEVQTAFDGVIKIALGEIAANQQEFNHTSKYLVHYTQYLLRESYTEIKDSVHQLHIGVTEVLDNERGKLILDLNRVSSNALNVISLKKSTELIAPLEKIQMLVENRVDQNRVKVSNLSDLLNLLNPESLLKKGYTISTIDNVDLTRYEGELDGAILKTLSDKHIITSEIKEVKINT